jgi:uncharacterized protein (TIGR02594 family)
MNLPEKYKWLELEGAPKMIVEALKLYGTKEIVGKQHNPVIMGWASETGLQAIYTADEVPWCGLVMAVIAKRAGKQIPVAPLWALNWAKFGNPVDTPMLGDVLTFRRPGGGHVGIYVGEDKVSYHVLGGNQGNAFNITRIEKIRLYKARRPAYSIAAPSNVRRIYLSSVGVLSKNEA